MEAQDKGISEYKLITLYMSSKLSKEPQRK